MFRSLFSRFGKQRRPLSRCACLTRSFASVEALEERTLLSVSTAIYSDLYEPGLFSGDAESQVAHIDFTFGDTPVIEDEGQGASVLWDGVDTWEVEGDPLVPYSSLTVLLPQGMDITSVTVSYGDAGEVLDTGVALQAAPTPMPISEWEEPEEYELVTTDFPEQDPVMFSSGSMCGYRLGNITLFPVTYDATSEALLYHSDITLTVTTEPVEYDGDLAVRDYEDDQAFVGMMVENPEMLSTYAASGAGIPEGESRLPAAGPYEYVIITSSELYVDPDQPDPDPYTYDFADLIRHKRDKGLTATIVTTDYIDANYDGLENDFDPTRGEGDLADKIREFLWEAWQDPDPDAGYDPGWGTQWVLLGGDVATSAGDADVVPMRYATGNEIPTDMYYACLEGPWNYDGDQYWAVLGDGTNGGEFDCDPDICVGRAPVRTAGEIHNFVAKTIQYETQTHANYDQGELITDTKNQVYELYTIYPRQCRHTLEGRDTLREESLLFRDCKITERHQFEMPYNTEIIKSDLNASPHFVNHIAHSNSTINAKLYPQDVLELTNTDPYIFYSGGCFAGALDNTGPLAHSQYCMAEAHVLAEHAAVAVVMNTREGWYGTSERVAQDFWSALFADHKHDFDTDSYGDFGRQLGAAHVYSLMKLDPYYSYPNILCFCSTTLFGDPELQFQADINRVDTNADLETVDYRTMVDLNLVEEVGNTMVGDRYHQLQTAHDGYLTVIALYDETEGNADLLLRDSLGQVVATAAAVDNGKRLDWLVDSSETYYVDLSGDNPHVDLRIVNLVEPDAAEGQITVHGSDAYDEFTYPTASYYNISINGVSYNGFFDILTYPKVCFAGNDYSDAAYLADSSGDDTLVGDASQSNQVLWNLSGGKQVVVTDANVYVNAAVYTGDTDTAVLTGSDERDIFRTKYNTDLSPVYEYFCRAWDEENYIYARRATSGFTTVEVDCGEGDDEAYLIDSYGDDSLVVDMEEESAVFDFGEYANRITQQYRVEDVEYVETHCYTRRNFFGGDDTLTIYDPLADNEPVIEEDMTVSGYHKGIVGVVIDVDDLPQGVTIDAADFQFRVGNTVETSTWSAAPAPSNIIVHEGEGENGADRIEIAWAEDSILDQWLEVTVLASGDVGVPVDDVFYFGALRGDTDGDGDVDFTDHVAFSVGWFQGETDQGFREGDFDLDGDVDQYDYDIFSIGWFADDLVDLEVSRVVGEHLYHKLDGSSNPVIEEDMTVSGYHKGIVGVVIDVDDLPQGVTIDAADFQFRVGNTVETSTWSAAPAPSNIIVHEGEGENGADRIEIAWAEDSILDQWLEVTVLASGDVGVPVDDVFYFGALRGDTNSDGRVDAVDQENFDVGWFKGETDQGFREGDFDLDGDVDWDDFVTFSVGWFGNPLVALDTGTEIIDQHLYHKLDGNGVLYAHPTRMSMKINADGPYNIRTYNFESVDVYSRGGSDMVYFHGSDSDDVFESRYDYSSLTGSGFSNTIHGFDEVYADLGQGGSDVVHLYDSSGDDMLSADDDWAQMTRAIGTLLCRVDGLDLLDTVFAYHSDGDDDDDIATPLYALDLTYWV